jgi:hypothetical protein
MGEAITKEVKELAEKAQAMLPKRMLETSSDKLPILTSPIMPR